MIPWWPHILTLLFRLHSDNFKLQTFYEPLPGSNPKPKIVHYLYSGCPSKGVLSSKSAPSMHCCYRLSHGTLPRTKSVKYLFMVSVFSLCITGHLPIDKIDTQSQHINIYWLYFDSSNTSDSYYWPYAGSLNLVRFLVVIWTTRWRI